MGILINKTQGNFTMVSQTIVRDTGLSLTDRGLLLTLLSLPDNWHLTIAGLAVILPDGKDKISKSLQRLIQKGYVTRIQGRNDQGRFGDIDLEVHETPIYTNQMDIKNKPKKQQRTEGSSASCPQAEKRETDKQAQFKNKELENLNIKKTATSADDAVRSEVTMLLAPYNLQPRDIDSLLKTANGNIGAIRRAVRAMETKQGTIRSVTGWLISAIQNEYDVPIIRKTSKKTSSHFRLERDYDFDLLEEELLHRPKNDPSLVV